MMRRSKKSQTQTGKTSRRGSNPEPSSTPPMQHLVPHAISGPEIGYAEAGGKLQGGARRS
eukprot:3576473-Rhodomonas_salina.2